MKNIFLAELMEKIKEKLKKKLNREVRGNFKEKLVALNLGLIALVFIIVGFAISGYKGMDGNVLHTSISVANAIKVNSADQSVSIEVPADWRTDEQLNEEAVISAQKWEKEQFVIVLRCKKLSSGTLQDYLKKAKNQLNEYVEKVVWSKQTSTLVGNLNAISIEARGSAGMVDVKYWFCFIQGKNDFYKVIGWTLQKFEGSNKEILNKVISSFRER